MTRENLTRFAWLSILAAVLTIALKSAAYYLTGSVGLLSDALESLINLVAAVIALVLLHTAAAPPDDDHAFGHDKAEYFSSAIEGTLIIIAAAGIAWAAIERLLAPQPLEQIGLGLLVTSAATAINLFVGLILLRVGRTQNSITLEADGKHLLTDVWTSVGVAIGILAVWASGWLLLDPLIALLVAANITWTGFDLLKRSALGLMDTSLPPGERQTICDILESYVEKQKIEFHAFRTRQSAARKFVSVHILVPGHWTVHRSHQLLEQIEADIRRAVKGTIVFTHLESLDDPASWHDVELDRNDFAAFEDAARTRSAEN